MKKCSNYYHQAYTLIELLLVITLLAVMASIGIRSYRAHMQSKRIDRAAIEMQQVLEAALDYNVVTLNWPANNNDLPNCNADTKPELSSFISRYLPNGQVENSFGHHYCWAATGGDRQTKALFWVAIAVPNQDVNMAKRIAARLPNAITTADPNSLQTIPPPCNSNHCYVRAEVSRPGTMNSKKRFIWVAAGNCKTGETIQSVGTCIDNSPSGQQTYKIIFPACPIGMKPKAFAEPNYLMMPPAEISNPIYQLNASVISCINTPDSNHQESCQIRVIANICWSRGCQSKNIKTLSGGKVGATYQVACVQSKEGDV